MTGVVVGVLGIPTARSPLWSSLFLKRVLRFTPWLHGSVY